MIANFGEYPVNEIITGDSRLLAKSIPDESIDVIFTDPIYQNQDDYIWLAEIAKRILKPEGSLLCWSNGKWHRVNANWLEGAGLCYRYDFTNIMVRAVAPMNGHIVSKANRVLWFDLEGKSKMIGYLADGASTTMQQYSRAWSWSKSPKFCEMALEAFARPGSLVYDPFCGEGSIPAVCKKFGYSFIASEVDSETSKKAHSRVRQTHYAPTLAASNTASSRLFEGWGELPAVANQSESDLPA